MRRLAGLLFALPLVFAAPVSAAPSDWVSYTFRQDVVDFDHSLEFDVYLAETGHLEATANWAGSWLKNNVLLYVVQPDVAECSISGGKHLSCVVGEFFPGDNVAPAGWYEAEVAIVNPDYIPIKNVQITVTGDITEVVPPGEG